MEDVEYEDHDGRRYTIPADSLISANLRHFLTDPSVFPDPKRFWPNRFLSPDGGSVVKYEQMVPFGLGKRICMGEGLAKSEIFIFFAVMLQKLTWEVDPEMPRPDPEDVTMRVTTIPLPFHVKVKARS